MTLPALTLLIITALPFQAGASAAPWITVPGGKMLHKGTHTASLAIGGGLGSTMLGSKVAHDLILGYATRGWIVSGPVGHKWYRGNAELRAELFLGSQCEPDWRYVAGITPVLRYDFTRKGPWLPFVEAGAGLTLTDIQAPDLSTTWEFNITIGGGVHYFFRDHNSLSLEYRGLHMSNGGARLPNNGLNTHMFIVGLNWFY